MFVDMCSIPENCNALQTLNMLPQTSSNEVDAFRNCISQETHPTCHMQIWRRLPTKQSYIEHVLVSDFLDHLSPKRLDQVQNISLVPHHPAIVFGLLTARQFLLKFAAKRIKSQFIVPQSCDRAPFQHIRHVMNRGPMRLSV